MSTLILTLAIVGQHDQIYHFRTLPPAPGKYVHMQAPSPPSPMTDRVKNDPFGFTVWLNATRLMYGRGPVVYDQALSDWAALNNRVQRERSEVGHFVLGPARRQNAAVVTGDISPYVGWLWMDSDEHRHALLDPSIARYGIAWDGFYFTWNAR